MSPIRRTQQTPRGDGFVVRYASDGKSIIFATYKPRTESEAEMPTDVVVDREGDAYTVSNLLGDDLTGWLVSKVRADGGQLLFDNPLGPFFGLGMGAYPVICLLPNNQVVVGGRTFLWDLPAVNTPNATLSDSNPWPEAYLAKYDTTTGDFISGAYLGGNGDEWLNDLFPSRTGNIMAVGHTWTKPEWRPSGFPITDPLLGETSVGAFVTELSAEDFSIVYSTVVGGLEIPQGAASDPFGNVIAVGYTDGGLPAANAAQPKRGGRTDGFVLKLGLGQHLSVSRSGAELVFSWPASTPELVLEATSSVGPGAVWERVTAVPVIANQQQTVTLRAEGGARFFRLREL
jgi:hypothetical protein